MKVLFIIIPIITLIGFGIAAYFLFANGKENRKVFVKRKGYDGEEHDDYTYKDIWKPLWLTSAIVSVVLSVISVLVLIIVPGSYHQVEAGQVAVVKVWGEAKEVRTAGLHFDLWISHKYEYYDAKVQQVDVATSAYSNDGQAMDIEIVVQYQIQQENIMKIAKNYGDLSMLESRIGTVTLERTKAVLSAQSAMDIIQNRATISQDVTTSVEAAITSDYYVNISTVVLTDISFSDAFEKTIEDKMIAEQEKQKQEIEAQAKLEVAKLEAEALKAKAEAEAHAIEAKADAEAYAITAVQQAWEGITDDAVRQAIVQKLAIEKWNGELPDTMVGDEFLQWLMGALNSTTTP